MARRLNSLCKRCWGRNLTSIGPYCRYKCAEADGAVYLPDLVKKKKKRANKRRAWKAWEAARQKRNRRGTPDRQYSVNANSRRCHAKRVLRMLFTAIKTLTTEEPC